MITRIKSLDYWGRLPHSRDVLDKFINSIYDSIGTCKECKHGLNSRESDNYKYCKFHNYEEHENSWYCADFKRKQND